MSRLPPLIKTAQKKRRESFAKKMGIGMLGSTAAGLAAAPVLRLLNMSAAGARGVRLSAEQTRALQQSLNAQKVVVREADGLAQSVYLPRYAARMAGMGDAPIVHAPKARGEILAHELGHHVGRRSSTAAKAMKAVSLPARALKLAPTLVAAFGQRDSKSLDYGTPAAALALGAPDLVDEGRASIRGIRGLRAAGVKDRALRRAKRTLSKTYATYLGATAAAAASPAIIRYLRRRWE